MPNYQKRIVYLSNEQRQELFTNGSITVGGQTIIYSDNDMYVTPQDEPVTDVQVNNQSIVQNGVANVPKASTSEFGATCIMPSGGINLNSESKIYIGSASEAQIKSGTGTYWPITSPRQHLSVFYGLAKAAGDSTQSQSSNPVGTYTDDAKEAIKSMLGIMEWISLGWRKAGESGISFSDGTEVSSNAFANTNYILVAPYRKIRYMQAATTMTAMTIGMAFYDKDYAYLSGKKGLANQSTNDPQPDEIDVPDNAVYARFTYRKDTQTYADFSISGYGYPCTVQDVQVNGTSILSDGVAAIPLGSYGTYGVMKLHSNVGNDGLKIDNGNLAIYAAFGTDMKQGRQTGRPITPFTQDSATFYGLAKASGADMKDISNPTVGVYPEAQKSAISQMLSAPVTVSGTTPSITAMAGVRYICGEVSTLDITVPESGDVEIIFDSGSTATVLTITPPTGVTAVKWANGFDPTSLDANTRYDIIITDGEWGLAASWA